MSAGIGGDFAIGDLVEIACGDGSEYYMPGHILGVLREEGVLDGFKVRMGLDAEASEEAFETDADAVRRIPERGTIVHSNDVEEGSDAFDCWYCREEKFYRCVILRRTNNRKTVVVKYVGFDDLDTVPLQYLSVPDADIKRAEDSSGATKKKPSPSSATTASSGGRQARRSASEPRPRPAPQKQKDFRQLRSSRANSHDEYVMQQDKDANGGSTGLPDFSHFFKIFSDGLAAVAAYFGVGGEGGGAT